MIYITHKAEQELCTYLRLAEAEISGFGRVIDQDGLLVITEVFILDQESGMAHTELDHDAMQDLLYRLIKTDRDPAEIGLWWHSHGRGRFKPSFSSIDDATIDRFELFGRPWMINLVSTQGLNHRVQFDYYRPIRATIEDVDLQRIPDLNDKLERRIQSEIDRLVRKPPPKVYSQVPLIGAGGRNDVAEEAAAYLRTLTGAEED